jgi:2-aminoethylphosphonate-pyruvate transaminase
VICRRDLLEASQGQSHSLALDLYDQWQAMEKNGQFRFTPPDPCAGRLPSGVDGACRGGRREGARRALLDQPRRAGRAMRELGFETLLSDAESGPIIQTFLTPADANFSFEPFYEACACAACHLSGQAHRARHLPHRHHRPDRRNGHAPCAVAAIRDVLADMAVTSGAPAR